VSVTFMPNNNDDYNDDDVYLQRLQRGYSLGRIRILVHIKLEEGVTWSNILITSKVSVTFMPNNNDDDDVYFKRLQRGCHKNVISKQLMQTWRIKS
jgi:hypothetical protein